MLRDIARRQQVELELRNARDAALKLEQAKSRLLANTSHELRTPLAGVIGMLELAMESVPDPHGQLRTAFETAQRLRRTLNELLNYASVEAQQPHLQLQEVCPTSLVRDLASGFALAAAEKGLELQLCLPDEGAIRLTSDRLRMQQIVSNLIDNAIRYSSSGTVAVSVVALDDKGCEISVSDTGCGISDDEQELIFEPFERGQSTNGDNGGKGLGLAIVQELVQAVGGKIELASELGVGSTFTVLLPEKADEFPGAPKDSPPSTKQHPLARSPRSESQDSAEPDLPLGLRILIAEDSEINRAYLAHVLRSAQCRVDEVDNGSDLVQQALQTSYDIILTDCRMPGLSGMDAVKRIRQAEQSSGKHVPIIAITAQSGSEVMERFFACGIDDILNKPVDRMDMIQKINHHLALRQVART